jgi:hypothetical protein
LWLYASRAFQLAKMFRLPFGQESKHPVSCDRERAEKTADHDEDEADQSSLCAHSRQLGDAGWLQLLKS